MGDMRERDRDQKLGGTLMMGRIKKLVVGVIAGVEDYSTLGIKQTVL